MIRDGCKQRAAGRVYWVTVVSLALGAAWGLAPISLIHAIIGAATCSIIPILIDEIWFAEGS